MAPAADDASPGELAREAAMAHGGLCYLQLPAVDVEQAVAFYERVLGWKVEREFPSFEMPGLIGQFVTDRAPSPEAGPIVWFNVTHMEVALVDVRAAGGSVISPPAADGPRRVLATVRDPAGNTVGLVQHGAR